MSASIFPRKILSKINQLLQQHSIVLVEGAYGTGKTSLLKAHFNAYSYVSLKNQTQRKLLEQDPYRFFNLYLGKTIFDDIEVVPGFPELVCTYSLSIYQSGNYILAANLKAESVPALAAPCAIFPMDIQELKTAKKFPLTLEASCIVSCLPGISNYKKYLADVFAGPFATLVRVRNTGLLFSLIKACARQVDQPLNLNAIAKELGVSQPTVQSWLNAFATCGLIHFLEALETSFQKRVIKSPKIYFSDPGLLAYLLQLKSPGELLKSPFFQSVYNNLVFLELCKKNEAENHPKPLRYWRESNGHEIHFLFENPTSYDIYTSITAHEPSKKDFKELDFFDEISEGRVLSRNIVYGGYKNYSKNGIHMISWQAV